jgi:hypothetical protein
MSTHAYTPRHSITIRPIGGIQSEEIQYCLNLLKSLKNSGKLLKAVIGVEAIENRGDSVHLHIRIIYDKRYRSAESTKLFKELFDEGRLSGRSVKTTQPTKSMRNQSEAVFWSYALKDSFTDNSKHWLFNVEMNTELTAACHEALLAHLERQVPLVIVTSTNVDTIMSEFCDRNSVSFQDAFVEMYKSVDPIYQFNFISARQRIRLSISIREEPESIDELLRSTWNAYIG